MSRSRVIWIFAAPQYDCAAVAQDRVRKRILNVASANDDLASQIASTAKTNWFEPQRCWALVERHDGTRRYEAMERDPEWLDEPGGAESPQAQQGHMLAAARSLGSGLLRTSRRNRRRKENPVVMHPMQYELEPAYHVYRQRAAAQQRQAARLSGGLSFTRRVHALVGASPDDCSAARL